VTADIVLSPSTELALPAVYPRADKNPALAYLMSLSEKNSRPTMRMALLRTARLLRTNFEPEEFPWHALRAVHTGNLRSELLALPPATANQTMAAVRGVLEWCWTFELISTDDRARAVAALKSVKGERLMMGRYIPREEIDTMLAACGDSEVGLRNRVAVLMLANSGLRREEIAELQFVNVHLDGPERFFTVIGKGNKERKLFINEQLHAAIRAWVAVRGTEPGPFLLAAAMTGNLLRGRSESLDGEAIFAAVKKLCATAGIKKVTPHDFRRTFISNLLAAGVDLVTVSKIAGHSDTKTTARYDRRGEEVQKLAMEHARGEGRPAAQLRPSSLDELRIIAETMSDQGRIGAEQFFADAASPSSWSTYEFVLRVFTSGGTRRRDFDQDEVSAERLSRLITGGRVSVEVHRFARADGEDKRLAAFRKDNESEEHSRMKLSTCRWLASHFMTTQSIVVEPSMAHGRPDLFMSEHGGVWVECGDTEARKVLRVITAGYSCLLVPFTSCEKLGGIMLRVRDAELAQLREETDREAWKRNAGRGLM